MIYVGNDEIIRVTEGADDIYAIYRGDTQVFQTPVIEFDDDNVKAICVANWGGNIIPDEITPMEAAAVTTLVPEGGSQSAFYNKTQIETFNELKYFTGLTTLNAAFRGCSKLSEITFPAATLSGYTCLTNCVNLTKVKIVDLRPLNINQSVAVDVRLHMNGSAVMEEVYFPQMGVRTLYSAFSGWTKLKKIDFSRCDFGSMAARASSQSTTAYAFNNCTSLTTIVGGFPNTKQDVPLGSCSSLTHDSALAVLNSLGTITSGSATVTFHNNVHLTAEEVAIGTNKGFTVTGYTLDS